MRIKIFINKIVTNIKKFFNKLPPVLLKYILSNTNKKIYGNNKKEIPFCCNDELYSSETCISAMLAQFISSTY